MPKPLTVHPSLAVLLAALLVLAALGLARGGWLERIDLMIYDLLLIQQQQPAPDEVTIIAIDEASLQQLGRWPWSRRVHARLIDRLTEVQPRAIALDLLLSEPDRYDPAADQQLTKALARNGKVVLAVAPEQVSGEHYLEEALPLPDFAASSAALGHVDFEIDIDGLCRRVFLYAGLDGPNWPALALATYRVGGAADEKPHPWNRESGSTGRWVRQQPTLIPYTGRERRFRYLSYADVLYGRVDIERLRDSYVLIGATAAGLGDALSTPMARAYSRTPGVELNANVLTGLLQHRLITEAPIWLHQIFTVVLVGVPLIVLISLGNRHVLRLLGSAQLLTLLITAILLYGQHLWFAPTAALAALGIGYLLMSWLRLQSTVQEVAKRARHDWQVTKIDGLTGLPSRERLRESLQTALPEVMRKGKMLGLLVLNLKRFKTVNDRFGIVVADRLLAEAAGRIRQVVRQSDLMVRLGNDEFGIMMSGLDNRQPVQDLANRIEEAMREPFQTETDPVILPVHLGATLFPADGKDADNLLQNAIAALHHARQAGLQELNFYSAELGAQAVSSSELELSLQGALQRGEFKLHYQPQVSTNNGRVVGVEALLRWYSPRHGTVMPSRFIPIAERTGMIVPIGTWVLEQACRQACDWHARGLHDLRMAVNLSAIQFDRPGLIDTVRNVLQQTGMRADRLELELTEGILIENIEATADTLSALKEMGVRISVDDFGTGYSSLSYLKRFPLDRIKIDRSFIAEVEPGSETADITLAIISIAHRLKLEVVAEGVETEPQQTFLLDHECDELQGYLFAKALPSEDLEEILGRSFHMVSRGEPPPLPV